MMILAIAAAMVAPSLRGFGRGRNGTNCAEQIIALTHWAHTQAIARSVVYRFNLDSAAKKYWITVEQDDGTIQPPGEEAGRVFTAPEGVTLSWTAPPQPDGQYVRFLPTGRLDLAATQPPGALKSLANSPAPVTIRVTGIDGHVTEIACDSATELFHEVTPQERQQQ